MQPNWPFLFKETCVWNHKLIKVYWLSRSRSRSNRDLLTVACNCSLLVTFFFLIFSVFFLPFLGCLLQSVNFLVHLFGFGFGFCLFSCSRPMSSFFLGCQWVLRFFSFSVIALGSWVPLPLGKVLQFLEKWGMGFLLKAEWARQWADPVQWMRQN